MHASSFAQSRKHPDILRCREYVSSGGGVSRCLSITGIRPWIRAAVLCLPKSNDSSLENGSPSIITASTCAFSIIWSQKNYVELRKEEQKLGFLCQNHGNIQHESKFIYRCNSSKINSLLDKVGITSLQSASKFKKKELNSWGVKNGFMPLIQNQWENPVFLSLLKHHLCLRPTLL